MRITFLSIALILGANSASVIGSTTVKANVSGKKLGKSIQYIGVNGNLGYNSTLMRNAGFNSYRIWDDMNNSEWTDDDGKYGWPSIAQIKADKKIANSGLINWQVWDQRMGNHRSFYDQLKADNIKLYLSLRNTCWGCQWLNKPPKTDNDWNEWFEHVFAEIYWLNVRNSYEFDYFEIFNEPDNAGQGWGGTEADYLKFAQVTADAINYVYETFIPKRKPVILGPAVDYPQVASDSSVKGKGWISDLLNLKPSPINAVSYHQYLTLDGLINGVEYVHGLTSAHKTPNMPIWISELGTYDQVSSKPQNDDIAFCIRFITSLIEMSKPSSYVYGLNYFIWQDGGDGSGIISQQNQPRSIFYALRLAIRALNHGKSTYLTTISQASLTAITTEDSKSIYFILANLDPKKSFTVEADVSSLSKFTGNGKLYRFDATHEDTKSSIALKAGIAKIAITPNSAVVMTLPAN